MFVPLCLLTEMATEEEMLGSFWELSLGLILFSSLFFPQIVHLK